MKSRKLGFTCLKILKVFPVSLTLMLFWSNFEELSSLHFWARQIRLHYRVSLAV